MRTTKGSAVSLRYAISVLGVVSLILGMLTVPSRALAEGDCGPRGGLGKPGCGPPTPNPSPVVLRGGQPGSTQRTAITIVLERGESLGQSSPGTPGKPGGVNIFIRTDSQPERQTTPEDAGYFLFMKDPMPNGGQLLIYQRLDQQQPNPPSRQDPFTEIQVLLVPIAPEPPTAPTNPQIRNWRTTRVNVLYEARQAAVNLIQRIGLPGVGLHTNPAAGLTNLPSWFWATVDQGQLDPTGSLTIPYPWITTWQEEVQVCDSRQVPGTDPPGDRSAVPQRVAGRERERHRLRLRLGPALGCFVHLVLRRPAVRDLWAERRHGPRLVRHQRSIAGAPHLHAQLAAGAQRRRLPRAAVRHLVGEVLHHDQHRAERELHDSRGAVERVQCASPGARVPSRPGSSGGGGGE